MKIETKYSINDRVWKITTRPKKTWIPCPSCGGTGKVELKDGIHACPTCYGNKGKHEYGSTQWETCAEQITIGLVRASVKNIKKTGMFDNIGEYAEGENTYSVEYMCYETGIGSGTIHYEGTLWPTPEEAQAECDRLNSEHKPEVEAA